MKKKRPIGISLASVTSIIFFGYSFLFFALSFPSLNHPWYILLRYILCLVASFLGIIASIFLFNIRHWARKLILFSCLFFLGLGIVTDITFLIMLKWFGIPSIFSVIDTVFTVGKLGVYIFWLTLMAFLINPKVKGHFK